MTVQIRFAAPDDAAALHRLAAITFPLACPPDALPESIAEFIALNLSERSFTEYLADPERELFVADEDGELLGYTMLVYGEPSDPDVSAAVTVRPTAELSKVYVHPDHHGAGLAAALVERSVAAAVARGSRSVWLGVNQQNARANRFYEKQGFARVGTKRFKVGARYEDDFVLERGL
ncbi:MAG: GNAT family N-acetyltransferase [Rhodoglobus sp.]|nr:GNAT family N-acetyltransferase [Rhodoglobus sp.]